MAEYFSQGFVLAALALLVESLVGYPQILHRRIGHPVEWIGALITSLDKKLNAPGGVAGRRPGVIAMLVLGAAVLVPAILLTSLLNITLYGWIANVALATAFLAQNSLRSHVAAVEEALGHSLASARREVGKIVGRDSSALDESGVSKAALESLAENASDGVVAPALWYAIAGLPGLVLYKAINTADSMLGHKSERHLNFGWAAARLDDLVNLPASRLTGLLFAGAAGLDTGQAAKSAWAAMWRDARNHNSPNAGWPESAMAGALGLRFGGPRSYDGENMELPWMGDGRTSMDRADIKSGLILFDRALLMLAGVFIILAIVL